MSVSIRLAKIGKRHAPAYRVVVTKTKSPRNGKAIENLGFYNPSDPKTSFTIDKSKYNEWVGKGAIVSQAVKDLVEGKYEYKKYEPKKKGVAEDTDLPEATEEKTSAAE